MFMSSKNVKLYFDFIRLFSSFSANLFNHFGIVNVLVVISILPAVCSSLVKYVPDRKEHGHYEERQ